MDQHHPTQESRSGGHVALIADAEQPGQGWLELAFPLDELVIKPSVTPGTPTTISVFYDYRSGSVCELLRVVELAHDRLTEMINRN